VTYVRVVGEADAEGPLREAYARIRATYLTASRKERGTADLPPIVTVFGARPALMEARVRFSDALYKTGASGLGRRKEELIAVSVAALSGCRYCALGHAQFLRRACGATSDEVARVIRDFRGADLAPDELAMLAFTEKMTRSPATLTAADRGSLRAAGFDDEAVVSVALGTGYRHFIDRIADLLGLEPDTRDVPDAVLTAFDASCDLAALAEPARGSARPRLAPSTRVLLASRPGAAAADEALIACIRDGMPARHERLVASTVASLLGFEEDTPREPRDAAEAALARLAERGTLDERSCGADDVDRLRAAGYDDAGTLSAVAAIAYHNYAVRVAAALGAP
jgi:uncharacterized peroxidase-related enzyme